MSGLGPGIAVLGATGRVGQHAVEGLRASGVEQIREFTRYPSRPGHRRLDLTDPSSLSRDLDDCTALLLLSPDAPDQAEKERAVLRAAMDANVEHIVKISAHSAGLHPPVSFGIGHRAVEETLQATSMSWTVLRPAVYTQSLLLFSSDVAKRGLLIAPAADALVAFVDAKDVAAAAVVALLRREWSGQILTLTGQRAVTFTQVAQTLSQRLDRRIRYVPLPLPMARVLLPYAAGLPRWQAALVADLFKALQSGAQAEPIEDLAVLLGRSPHSVESVLDEHLDAFRPARHQRR
jgi:uncharacterized protein YbjT (DUF2867 family)